MSTENTTKVKKSPTKTNAQRQQNALQCNGQSNGKNVSKKLNQTKTNRNQVSANWSTLCNVLAPTKATNATEKHRKQTSTGPIAIDCEMVGIGENGKDHMLARVSIVNERGEVILDKYVKPTEPIVDYRTQYSGIRPFHMQKASSFEEVQQEVSNIKHNRIVIGHALHNDFKVLKLTHPKSLIRDTALYKKCRHYNNGRTPSLRLLTNCILDYDIQTGAHCSVEDARAVMEIYQKFAKSWERSVSGRHYK